MTKITVLVLRSLLAGALCAGAMQAADDHLSTVKGLYIDREHHPAVNGLRFDVEVDRSGGRVEVPVTADFHSGERIWLRLDVRNLAYVYVLNRTLTGPDKGITIVRDEDIQRVPVFSEAPRLVFGPEKLNTGASRLVPKSAALKFDDSTGIEKLYVVLSPRPLDLETWFDNRGRLNMDDSHRDAIRNLDQKLAEWAENADTAVPDKDGAKGIYLDNHGYCVERRPNEPLMLEVTLRHSR